MRGNGSVEREKVRVFEGSATVGILDGTSVTGRGQGTGGELGAARTAGQRLMFKH